MAFSQFNIIARTLLFCWPRIDDYVAHQNKLIYSTALYSYNATIPVEEIAEKIINRENKKRALISLKGALLREVEKLEPRHSEVIKHYFFERKSTIEIALIRGRTSRTIFRDINAALDAFVQRFPDMRITESSFNNLLAKYKWIREEHEQQIQIFASLKSITM